MPITRRDLISFWIPCADGTAIPYEQHHAIRCPECGAPLAVDETAEAFQPETPDHRTTVRLAGCTGCEFVHVF